MVGQYKLLTLAKKGSIPGLPCLDLAILSNTLKISSKILKEEKTSILGIKPVRLRSYCLIHLRYHGTHLTGEIKSRAKQDHRRWRYHRKLLDYQSPFFQLIFPLDHRMPSIIEYLGSSNSFGSLKSTLSFEMTLRPSDHERS